jgi:hypothetical protein
MFLMINTTILTSKVTADYEEKPNKLIPTIIVKGGLGILITIYGITEETAVIVSIDDAIIRYSNSNEYYNHINLFVGILDFGAIPFGNFKLYISIGNDIYSYQCRSFLFIFTYGITPIDK